MLRPLLTSLWFRSIKISLLVSLMRLIFILSDGTHIQCPNNTKYLQTYHQINQEIYFKTHHLLGS